MNKIDKLIHLFTDFFTKEGPSYGYDQTEIKEMLSEIDFNTLIQAVRHNADTIYTFRTDSQCEFGLQYRGLELLDKRGTLLYEDVHDAVAEAGLAVRSTELWLLEDMSIAVVSCVSIIVGENELTAEYRVLKGHDWADCCIENLEDFVEDLQEMCATHYSPTKPFYEL